MTIKSGKLIITILILFMLFAAYTLFIWGPMNIYAEATCLSKGYPEYKVSANLKIYCINLNGTTTVKVDKQ